MLRILWTAVLCGLTWFAFFITQSIHAEISTWYAAKQWVQTTASISLLELKVIKSTETEVYKLVTRYTYEVNGKVFTNNKASFSNTTDNDAHGYNNQMYHRLNQAKIRGDEIQIWYDPNQPATAVIDKDLQFSSISMAFIFLFLLGGIGLSGLYLQAKILINGDDEGKNEETITKAISYPFLILLFTFCLSGFLIAISSVITRDYRGLVGLVIPGLILPIWIEAKRHFNKKKSEDERLAKPGAYQSIGIKGRAQSYASKIYLGILVLLISAPLAYIEATSITHYSWVSYFIFSLPIISLLIFFNATRLAMAYSKFGDIYLITQPKKVLIGKNITARIEGLNLNKPQEVLLTLMYFEIERSLGTSSSRTLVREEIAVSFVANANPKYFSFEFLLPEKMPQTQKTNELEIQFILRLDLTVKLGTKVGYLFEDIKTENPNHKKH